MLTHTKRFELLYALYVGLGVCGVPYFSAGLEQCCEMTFPVSEEVSSTFILILGNGYGFIFIIGLGFLQQSGYVALVGYIMVGLYAVSTLLTLVAKTELRRWNAEKEASLRSAESVKKRKNYSCIEP